MGEQIRGGERMEDREKMLQLYHSLAQKCNEIGVFLKDRNVTGALKNEVEEIKKFIQKFLVQLDEIDSINNRKIG